MTRHAETVYHLADIVAGIDFVFSNQAFLFDMNLRINLNTVRAARANRVPAFVYAATACSFPKELQSNYSVVSIPEDKLYPASPESSYGWSKLMGEYQLRREQLADESFQVGIVRLHNVYGPRSPYRKGSQALPALIRKAISYPAEGFGVMGTGRQYRDFLHVHDAVSAILAVRERGMNRGPIQAGTGEAVTLRHAAREVAKLARNLLGKRFAPTFDNAFEGDKGRVADLTRARAILGWKAEVTFSEGLKGTFKWIMQDMELDTHGRKRRSFDGSGSEDGVKRGAGRSPGHCGASSRTIATPPEEVIQDVVSRLEHPDRQVGALIDAAECQIKKSGLPVLNASLMYESRRSDKLVLDAAIGKLIMRMIAADPPQGTTWRWTSWPSANHKWAKYLRCGPDVDAWTCMFGAIQTPRADCSRIDGNVTVRHEHELLAVARMIVLQGHRASPLLEAGPAPLPPPFDGQHVNVSVHVRGGDACDAMEFEPMNNTWTWGRWELVGRAMRGHCVHPTVHAAYVQKLVQRLSDRGIKVDAILFATDSDKAQKCFAAVFPGSGSSPRLVSRAFDRKATANRKWKQDSASQWIEFRDFDNATGADVTASVFEDLRMLAQGHVMVGTMCSNLAALAWNLMVGHHRWNVPFISLDACVPQIARPDIVPEGKIHLPYGGSVLRPQPVKPPTNVSIVVEPQKKRGRNRKRERLINSTSLSQNWYWSAPVDTSGRATTRALSSCDNACATHGMICNQSVARPLMAAMDPTQTPNERAARAEWLRVVDVANEATGVNVDVSVRCTKNVGAGWRSYTTDTVPSYKDTGSGCTLPELGSVDDAYSFRCETFPSQSGRRRLCPCQVAPPPPWSGTVINSTSLSSGTAQ